MSKNCIHSIIITSMALGVSADAADLPTARMPLKHRAFFKKYCLDCHDTETREGKVDLESLTFNLDSLPSAELWQKILGALNSGEMPPKDETQPTAADKTSFLEDLSEQLVIARKVLSDTGGVITMRRLNRREYQNTLRDLLGVHVDVDELPDDGGAGTFDTVGASLFFSSDQFEQYLKISHRALSQAMFGHATDEPKTVRVQPEERANRRIKNQHKSLLDSHTRAEKWRNSNGQSPKKFGFIDAARVDFEERNYNQRWASFDAYLKDPLTKDGVLLQTWFAGTTLANGFVNAKSKPGDYILRVRVAALENSPKSSRFIEFGRVPQGAQSGELIVEACRQVTGTIAKPQIVEIPFRITPTGNRQIAVRQRQPNTREYARFIFLDRQRKTGLGPKPALWVDWIEWKGPLTVPNKSRPVRQIFFKGIQPQTDEYARDIIQRFARRAFRIKEPSQSFVDKLMGIYREHRSSGTGFMLSIKEALAVVLASPSFLYLIEPSPEQQLAAVIGGPASTKKPARRQLTDLELAVRLSYFLWSGPPDQELLQVARRGQLSQSNVLREQTLRLLADPRSTEFVRSFAHQWLDMERLDFFQFNFRKYPKFDESVKAAAREEVYQSVKHLLDQNESLTKLIESNYVVVNDLMADFYGLPDVRGSEFRVVRVPKDSPRGGLLGMAAIMAMGSDGERSSPVERGAWVMRKLLNNPPPPAPANVPQLSRLASRLLPARKLQAAHMEEPQCAQCHRKIDPIGYGLENFNAIGLWRDVETVQLVVRNKVKRKKEFEINPSGTLPDGTEFADFFELRSKLAKRDVQFAQGFTEALIEYGLGRPFGFSDHGLAENIMTAAESDQLRLRTFILAFVATPQFKQK